MSPFDEFQRADQGASWDEFERVDTRPDTRTVLRSAAQVNPDDASEALRLAKRYPAPAEVLLRNLQDAKLQAAVDAADERLRTSPKLAEHMRNNPWLAKQAHDDVPALTQIADFVGKLGGAGKAGVYSSARGASGLFRAAFELVAPLTDVLEPSTDEEQVGWRGAIGGNPLRRLAEGFGIQAAANDQDAAAVRPVGSNWLDSGVFSGVESLTQNVLSLPAALANPPAGLAAMGVFTGGSAYEDAREKGLPMSQALPFAASQATIEIATEKLPLAKLIGDVKAGTPFFQTLLRQIGAEVPGEQVATVLQDLNEWAALNPDKPFSAYLEERPSAAAQTLVATIVGAGGNVAVAKTIEAAVERATRAGANMQRAGAYSQALEQALKAAEASALRERDPEAFRALMADLSDNGTVYVDAEALNQMPAGVLQQMQGVASELPEALATGGAVAVKLADAMTLLAGTPQAELFMQHARMTPNAPSAFEAEEAGKAAGEFLRAEAERTIAEAQDQAAAQASSDAVKQTLVDQLTATGRFSPAVNDGMATWAAAFYTTMGARVGMTAEQFYAKYPLRVLGAPSSTAAGPVIDQGKPGRLDGIEAFHYSPTARPVISTHAFGTGLAGDKRDAYLSASDPRRRQRAYFYVDKGTGINPEAGVGGIGHKVTLGNIYDANSDPLRLRQLGGQDAFESAVLDAGFDGYLDRMDGTQSGQVILLGDRTVTPEVLGPTGKTTGTVVPPPAARASLGRDVIVDKINAMRDLPAGAPSLRRWGEILQARDPEVAQALRDAGVLEGSGVAYKDELVRSFIASTEAPVYAQPQSSRLPGGKKATEDPLSSTLAIDWGVTLSDPVTLEKNVEALQDYPNTRKLTGKGAKDPVRRVEAFIDHVVQNLLWLHDHMPADMRDRARLWYDGARKTVELWADRYGISEMQGAAAIAVLSPQNDWFTNVSQAERIADAIFGARDFVWDDAMTAEAQRVMGDKVDPKMQEAMGKTLGELLDQPDVAARWIRVYDQTHNSRHYRVLTPEGGAADYVKVKSGAEAVAAWKTYGAIAKAVSVFTDGRAENVHYQIGQEHKVRNFYNNIFGPRSELGFATIDTHAVAAALLRPLAGGDTEVIQAFGGAGSASSLKTGLNGTYPIFLEAYRRAAEQRGLLPREMQSITWEAVRGLFEAAKKDGMKGSANAIWLRYKKGEITQAQAQQEILALAGDVTPPSWTAVPFNDQPGRTYEGPAQAAIDAAQAPGKTEAPGARVMFEVAPDPNDQALTEEWNALSPEERLRISQDVAARVVPEVLREVGTAGDFVMQLGGYLGATNPSMTLRVARPELALTAAKLLGHALSQDSMMVVTEQRVVGADPVGAITITLPDGYGEAEVAALYDRLWQLEHGGEKLVGGHTTADGRMVVLNYSPLSTEELGAMINAHLGDQFEVTVDTVHSAFPSKEDYGYAAEDQPAGDATTRQAPAQRRPDRLRGEATRLLREALDARRAGVLAQGGLTQPAVDQTLTPEFKAWFGRSQAVVAINAETGAPVVSSKEPKRVVPQVMYHTTRNTFDTFEAGRPTVNSGTFGAWETQRHAIFVTPEREASQAYGTQGGRFAPGANVMPLYIKAENPLDLADGVSGADAAALEAAGMSPRFIYNGLGKWGMFDDEDGKAVVELIKAAGYDSVIFNDENPDTGEAFEAWAVFTPSQIKSAIGNDGSFDAADPSILSQGPRGTFNPRTLELVLSPTADLSTFFHETGHFFLEVMADLASQPGAPAQIVGDMGTILAWFGVKPEQWAKMTLDQKRPYHERWAESVEQYVMEGKAPSKELQGPMRRFAAWLKSVYKSIKQFLTMRPEAEQRPLNDDIRRVMDRMLATDEQIAQANEEAGLQPDEDADAEAAERLNKRSMADLKWAVKARDKVIAKLRKQASAIEKAIREEVIAQVDAMPEYAAAVALRKAEKAFANDPTSADMNAATIADAFGFPSVDAMMRAIEQAGSRQDAIDSITQRRMLEEHGDLVDEDAIRQAAIEAVHNEARARSLATELRTQREMLNPRQSVAEDVPAFDLSGELRALAVKLTRAADSLFKADLQSDAQGVIPGKPTRVNRSLASGDYTLDEAAAPWQALRDKLREQYGDTVTLYRADAPANERAEGVQVVYMGDQALASRFALDGREAKPYTVRVDDIVAAYAPNENYVEFVVKLPLLEAGVKRTTKGNRVTVNALVEAAKQFGAAVAGRTVLTDLRNRAWQHTAAERRAAKRWAEATAAGKTDEAVKAKQDQLLNNAAAKAVMEARAEAQRILDFFKRVAKGNSEEVVDKGRDADVVNAARAVLAAYGVQTATTKAAVEYLEAVKRNDPETYNVLAPIVDGATRNAQPLDALTFDQLLALREDIGAMWHLAKRMRQMEVAGNLIDIEEAADELHARMVDIGIPDSMPGETGAVTKAEERARWMQFARALLARVEQWTERMDGKWGGPFTRFIFQPIKQAADAYRTDRLAYRKQYQALLDAVAPALQPGLIEAPELGYTFGRGHNGIGAAELLHALLHTGNESNKRKLLLGRQWAEENPDGTLDTRRWDAFVTRMINEGKLTKAHYDFAQGVWDLLEQTKPLAQKAHRDVFGRYFAEVTADGFVTPFGTYRGGYVPAQADPAIVNDADLRALAEMENESMAYSFPTTSKGFTKARVEYNRPLKLDLRTIPQHLDKVLLFSHMEPAVRGVAKLLRQRGVSQALGRIDPAAYSGMLLPWLNRSARQQVETPVMGDGRVSRVLSALRSRAGAAVMFANISNAVQQLTGFSNALVLVKASHVRRGVAQMIAHPKRTRAAVAAASPYMAARMSDEVATMSDAMDEILLNPSTYERAQAWAARHSYFLQAALDNAMSPMIWLGAYNQALADGMPDADAVAFADGVIRKTQGSILPEDVSRLETGPAYARLFTQFVSYFNMMANTNGTALAQIAGEMGLKKGAGKALGVLFFGMLAPIWMAEAIALAFRGGPDDEDEDGYLDDWLAAVFGIGTIKGTLAQVPFIAQIGQVVMNRFNSNPADDRFSLSPAVSLLESAASVPHDIYKAITNGEVSKKLIRDSASLASLVTGVPVTAAAKPLGYVADVANDKVEPTGPVDAARGLVTGTASPDSKQ